jgi:hypothetical protein
MGVIYGSFIHPPSLTISLYSTELDMEDEELRWDTATFESLANANANTNFVTLAKRQLAGSLYNTTWRASRGADNENTGASAELRP